MRRTPARRNDFLPPSDLLALHALEPGALGRRQIDQLGQSADRTVGVEIGELGLAVASALHQREAARLHVRDRGVVILDQDADMLDAALRVLPEIFRIAAGAGQRLDQLDLHLTGEAECDALAIVAGLAEIDLVLDLDVLLDQEIWNAEL